MKPTEPGVIRCPAGRRTRRPSRRPAGGGDADTPNLMPQDAQSSGLCSLRRTTAFPVLPPVRLSLLRSGWTRRGDTLPWGGGATQPWRG